MLKKGILFQGLQGMKGGGHQDITYLFLYGLSRNILCRAKIRDMKREWREYLLEKADRSTYQSAAFWKMLKKEEKSVPGSSLDWWRICETVMTEGQKKHGSVSGIWSVPATVLRKDI